MTESNTVTITLTLSRSEVLATLAKRLGYADCREASTSADEAYEMVHALAELRQVLAREGVYSR